MNAENQEWQEPPVPEQIPQEPEAKPEMSEPATLVNIFIEPGKTFDDLKIKPRFILATLIFVLLVGAYSFGLTTKIGEEGLRRFINEQIDKNPQAANLPADQKKSAVDLQMTISKVSTFVSPVFLIVFVLIGSTLYWAGGKAFGGEGGFLQALSVFSYSSFAPTLVAMIANFALLFLKSADEIDLAASQRGLFQLNPAMFLDGKSMPVLTTVVSFFDVFAIWGWALAAIGLARMNRISTSSAWIIVMAVASIGFLLRVIGAVASGNPS